MTIKVPLVGMTLADAKIATVMWAEHRDTIDIARALLLPEHVVVANLDAFRIIRGALLNEAADKLEGVAA